jgi:predicted metalloprotease with PDZ domain
VSSYRRARRISKLLAAFVLLLPAVPAQATIKYRISLEHPEKHSFDVTMTVPVMSGDVVVAMPAWNALYQIRDFSYRVRADLVLSGVKSAIAAVPPEELDKQTWRLCRCASAKERPQAITFAYSIKWNEPSPFDSQLNEHHAFLNLAEVLMYVPDRRGEDVEVQFENVPPGWKMIAELAPGPDPNSFIAPGYDELVDAPVEIGAFDEFDFDSGGAHFRLALDSNNAKNLEPSLQRILQRVTSYEIQLMGGPPFKEYTFIFHVGSRSEVEGGGMEHANSTAISANSQAEMLELSAHEFFHAWNVKRIRPRTLEPVDYTKEQYTRALWFAEGVTSTYGAYTLERTQLWSKQQFYDDLAAQITELESRPAHQWQSVEDSSLDAWLEKYDEYNLPARSISYYNKGQILGVILDLAIRDATGNRKSLDDVMRRMNDEYAKQHKFYDDSEGVRAAVEEVAGASFQDFFRRYVAGVEEIPFDKFLDLAGLQLNIVGAKGGAYSITEAPHPTDRQRRIRDGILRGTTD